ncbi:nudix hydrolase 6 [Trichuris trichiura]|uniref:Nudix hydrolase 6 n=1 Tax=Trichuris trichiura TaxID=36087 RepID=A0A077ZD70_TRITR|nr:nudix hydrolase 6 [Trichuris trichiura]
MLRYEVLALQIARVEVTSSSRPWAKSMPNYHPLTYTRECNSQQNSCDPDISDENFHPQFNELDGPIDRRRMPKIIGGEQKIYMTNNSRPLNPKGRTGIAGRGDLNRWGPNHLVYVMLSRGKKPREYAVMPTVEEYELPDYPHVFVDNPLENPIPIPILQMLRTKLREKYKRAYVEEMMKVVENSCVEFYRGYFTDQRNTDNAWIEMRLLEINDPKYEHIGLIDFQPTTNPFNLTWTIFDREFFHKQIRKQMAKSDTKMTSQLARRFKNLLLEIKVGTPGYRFMLFRTALAVTSIAIGAATLG